MYEAVLHFAVAYVLQCTCKLNNIMVTVTSHIFIKGALDKYNIYLFISNSIEGCKLN